MVDVRQEQGPSQRFIVVPDVRCSPTVRTWLFQSGFGWLFFLTAIVAIGSLRGFGKAVDVSWTVFFGAALGFGAIAAALGRASDWYGDNPRYHLCEHTDRLPDTVATAGSPVGKEWAAEALAAFRAGSFCRGSQQLHEMMRQPVGQLAAKHSPNRDVADLVLDAAIALREHDRLDDAGDVLLFVDVVPTLPTLDGETARQAAQTILDSYRLLDDIPSGHRTVVPADGSSTPAQDATAAVDAALRGIDGIVETSANEHIQALQALRIYSKRWDAPGGLE